MVLDSLPLNPGDLDWTPLRELGDLTLFENTSPAEVAERVRDADVVYTNKVRVRADALGAASNLKLVSVLATGYDIIDLDAARQQGVTVCNVPAYGTNSVAQTTIALLLELTHHAGAHDAAIRDGQWQRAGFFSFWNYPLVELADKTLLIVGMGAIGSKVAQIATALGMKVSAAQLPGRTASGQAAYPRVPLQEALPQADVISLHTPLTPETRALINAERLSQMKQTALLLNTARGLLVDEAALAEALRDGRIAGYAADVLSTEPPASDNPLFNAPHCNLTPHLSWASFESRQRLMNASVENLRAFLLGKPQNVVS
ncbi:MAG: D-2-hydroxyacid dehydrogenase [Abitibacteriaceae bacterium]|nr:D-2-hydroxyacid dehydrogenase [Abditibacteriaceae bacterium]